MIEIKEQMAEEIGKNIQSLGEWASQKENRIAFVVCGEIGDDGGKNYQFICGAV